VIFKVLSYGGDNGQQWTHLYCALLVVVVLEKISEEETKVLRAINIMLDILDQFIHFCCSSRRWESSKVIDKKS
jgi:hypothetical protein